MIRPDLTLALAFSQAVREPDECFEEPDDIDRVGEAIQRCTSVIESRPRGGHAAALPFDPKDIFGRARTRVAVTVEGNDPFYTTIAFYGGVAYVGFRKAQLAEMHLEVGSEVEIMIESTEA